RSSPRSSERAGGRAYDGGARRHVTRHDRPRADRGTLADADAAEDDRARADRRPPLEHGRLELPVLVGLKSSVVRGRARPLVVDEHDPVADVDLVADLDAGADERVALDLAA